MPETVDIICEKCGSAVLGTLTRSSDFTDAQWTNAIARSRTGYRCTGCAEMIRAPNWWPHGWWAWPPQEEPPPFWPDDLDWPPANRGALVALRARLRPRPDSAP